MHKWFKGVDGPPMILHRVLDPLKFYAHFNGNLCLEVCYEDDVGGRARVARDEERVLRGG